MLMLACQSKKEEAKPPQPELTGPFAEMTFEEETYDFGKVIVGGKLSHTFKFTNTGEVDLLITKAKGNCGCTVADYPKNAIKPGQGGEISVTFDTSGRMGTHKKSVFITANIEKKTKRIFIKANVRPRNEAATINKQ